MCDPTGGLLTAGALGLTALTSRPRSPQQAAIAPAKTDADVARAAEDERRRLGYGGPRSLSNNFVSFGSPSSDDQPLKRVSLGA